MHLMQSGREEEEESVCCIVHSLVFVVFSYKLFRRRRPFGRPLQGKLDVSTTVRECVQFVCASAGIMGWLLE